MPYVYRHSAFTVTVGSGFVKGDRFVVKGQVVYQPHADRDARKRASTLVRLAILAGIAHESQWGQALGARRVYVDVDGDTEISRAIRRLVEGSRLLGFSRQARLHAATDH